MPRTHERTFRVRHYECDAFGHVNHATYLRYMQEAAMDASAAVGYDLARYAELERHWLIRETNITYLRPLTYGDAVTVRTWVADFRRVRSRRAYALRYAGTGEPVAQAMTDWVYLDSATLRPVTIPDEMIAAFHPEGSPDNAPRRERFPDPSLPPEKGVTFFQRVAWRDLDLAQHVNNATYLAYIENCGVEVAAAHGWPMARMMEAGFGMMVRRYRIEHKLPALLGDDLAITTWITDVQRSLATRTYTIMRPADGALLARAHVVWVWIDLQSGRPIRIPADFMADFADNMAV